MRGAKIAVFIIIIIVNVVVISPISLEYVLSSALKSTLNHFPHYIIQNLYPSSPQFPPLHLSAFLVFTFYFFPFRNYFLLFHQ